MKCYKCKKEWHRRKGSFLESRHISYSKFIGFLVLFSKDNGVIQICNELSIDRKNGLLIHSELRKLLFRNFSYEKVLGEKIAIQVNDNNQIEMQMIDNSMELKNYLLLEISRYKETGGIYSFLVNSKWIGQKIRNKNLVDSFISYIKMKSISYRGISKKIIMYTWEN